MELLDQLKQHKYLNLETFRKNGEGVKTPVWFAQEGDILFVQTATNTGKVKRIRNDEHVNVASCTMNGKLVGRWVPAQARFVKDPEVVSKANLLLNKKYDFLKKNI